MALRQLSTNNPEGCIAPGLHSEIIQGVVGSRLLLPEESGSLCLYDSSAGIEFVLPIPVLNMRFEFMVITTVTSGVHKMITDAATSFLRGAVMMGSATVAESGDVFNADGNSHVALTAGGTTTGGVIGETYIVRAISATQWAITGVCQGSGTLATPFATS